MTPLSIGFGGIGVMLLLLALRVPIAVALGGTSLLGIAAVKGWPAALAMAGTAPYAFAAKWELSAIPMFLLMGSVAFHSGMTANLFAVARLWLSRLPGGLAVATNFACAGFAAASGSSMATAASMARLSVPEMLRHKYDPGLATGVVAAAGTLGSLIPPSILMIIYGMMTETSIGQLFLAGILPGILTAVVYAIMIILRVLANPELAPAIDIRPTWKERFVVLLGAWQLPILIVAVIGGLYSGIATTTEVASLGALAAIIMAAFNGTLSVKMFKESLWETLATTAMILFISIGAVFLTRFLTFCGLPQFMANLAADMTWDPLVLMLFVALTYLILGMFLDAIGLMLLTVPIFMPMFQELGTDKVWLGIMVIKFIEIGLITPPVGLNAYVVKGVVGDRVSLNTIFQGLLWFIGAELIVVVLLYIFPQIALVIPQAMI